MTTRREDPPSNLRSLEARVANLARSQSRPVRRLQRVIANTAIGQMLPPSVVKGGTALKLRVGEAGSRFTPDLDASRPADISLDHYIADLADQLAAGWGGFTGTIEEHEPAQPEGVPDEYIMRPFAIRLADSSRHWLTVTFELGHDEIGSTSQQERRIAADILEIFDIIGLNTPEPIAVLALDHQIAQKLHACTAVSPKTGRNERAHDLVDLQILDQEEAIDMPRVAATGARLFAARHQHPWPPTIVAYERWETIYAEAASGLDVLDNVADAVAWANNFIARTLI